MQKYVEVCKNRFIGARSRALVRFPGDVRISKTERYCTGIAYFFFNPGEWMASPDLPPWLLELSMLLQRDVAAAEAGIIRIEVSALTALWACSPVEAEWILSEAATHAGLAVGVAQEGFFDVMTIEEAHAALDEMQEAHRPKRPH